MTAGPAPPPRKVAVLVPVAEVNLGSKGEPATVSQTYPVFWPKQDANDPRFYISGSQLRRWRRGMQEAQRAPSIMTEVLLAIGTLAIGGALSAAAAGVRLESDGGLWFFVVLPVVGAASIVAFILLRYHEAKSVGRASSDVIAEIDEITPPATGGAPK